MGLFDAAGAATTVTGQDMSASPTGQFASTPAGPTGENVTFAPYATDVKGGDMILDQRMSDTFADDLDMGQAAMRGQIDERVIPFLPPTRADQAASTHGGQISHIYQPDRGDPGWGQTQAWGLAGFTPGYSTYDADFDNGKLDNDFHSQVAAGFKKVWARLPLSAPTMTRDARWSAQRQSLPAARFFQSYTGAGTGRNWSGAQAAQGQRSLRGGWNPNMQGAAELHPATTYDPFPSPASLYPKVV